MDKNNETALVLNLVGIISDNTTHDAAPKPIENPVTNIKTPMTAISPCVSGSLSAVINTVDSTINDANIRQVPTSNNTFRPVLSIKYVDNTAIIKLIPPTVVVANIACENPA